MRLLKETYKTLEGARKRAAFENGLAKSEFEHGYKAKHYTYRVVPGSLAGTWKVERLVRPRKAVGFTETK